jgi:hypothetical protein
VRNITILDAPFAKATAAVVKARKNVDDRHGARRSRRAFEQAVDRDIHRQTKTP